MASLSALVVALRLHTSDEPLERDLTTYAYVAHRVLSGDSLYESVWDHKPPAIYAAYALAELAFGYGQQSVAALGAVTAIATLALTFAGLRRLGGRTVAWVGTTVFALVSTSTALQANQPNVEVFLNLATAAILWAAAASSPALAGVALAIGTLFKLNFVFYAFPLVFLAIRRDRPLPALVATAAPGLAAWSIIAVIFALQGRLGPFVDAVFGFNWEYSGGMAMALKRIAQEPMVMFPTGLREIALVLVVAGLWLLMNRRAVGLLPAGFFLAWFLGTFLAVISPGQFHPHYAQLWLPLVCTAAAIAVVEVARSLDRLGSIRPSLALAFLAIVFAAELALPIIRDLGRSAREISVAKYGSVFVDTRDLARIVAERTAAEDVVYEWGSETGIYFYARRRSASPIFHLEPLVFGSDEGRARRAERVFTAVQRERPALIVWARPYGLPGDTPLGPFLERSYRPAGSFSFFDLYELADRPSAPSITKNGPGK